MEGVSDEDSFVELYCEEVEDTTSTPWFDGKGDCQETDAGGKVPCPPVTITVYDVSSETVSQPLDTPAGEVESYIVTFCREGKIGVQNSFHSHEEVKNENITRPVITSVHTKTHLERFLEDLGMVQHFTEKLSLSKILQIDERTITDETAKCQSDLPWYFLKKLMMVNVTARNVKCISECESACDAASDITEFNFDNLLDSPNSGDMLNPLDIITALFLCSDAFVQQEMALKMSMCQFSVPLLLPNCDTQQCTLMLWALRDMVKKYRPQSLSQSKGFFEDRIVLSELPMISFVRLGECSLSKSEILNKLLSNSQQYHDTFVHRNMECGDSPRRISDGLTEITWYLPRGKTSDIFSVPVAVANLRGDITSFETQFSFLCQTSAAVFVFFDNLDTDCKLLTNQHHKAQIFLVGNHQSKHFNLNSLKKVAIKLGLTNNNILIKTKQTNDADFVKNLRKTVKDVVDNSKMKMCIEQMADIAHELGISVDEDCPECQTAKKNADAITAEIQDTLKYKQEQLPLQGQIWKDLTSLEKEEFRLRKVGSEAIETYRSGLQVQKRELRDRQNSYNMSNAMTCFINAISSPGTERCYFLKWMRINLDNLSRERLSDLREQYKEKSKNSENKDEIKDIDRELSNSSLGTEHFFREMGQIYEASVSLPETDPSRQQLQHLPKLWAGLLLDGFPLELVDGDASNIPLRWVSDVLSQLHDLVSPKNKILVVTVLGVQSTGKSTLLNTMFGVQFAVSSGRCTRGAFMLLIRINEDVRKVLNCDFMVIIDTEGLKSPELAQLDDSHEHDNELATLVIGLSDITIINIAMENSTEMKDILQIVVHAFLRMKEVGKKPKCQFVHQNGHIYLVEGYKEDFANSAKSLRREMENSVFHQLTAAAEIKQGMRELDTIKENHTKEIEKAVCALIDQCRKKNVQMRDHELEKEFNKMWNETVKKLSFSEQKATDVFTNVSYHLRTNLSYKGSHASKLLSEKNLKDCGKMPFKYTEEGFCIQVKHRVSKWMSGQDHIMMVQKMADSIIACCIQFVTEIVERKNNYSDTYIQEMLQMIDERLQNDQDLKTGIEFEVSLKQHICGVAARKFQKMHEDFLHVNDPYRCLDQNKGKFCADFKDVFHKRDQCQKKAEEFTSQCLKPAVEDFINRSLGPDIIDEMLTQQQFSTRIFFQYSVLLDLLTKDKFEKYLSYICSYEEYVKKWTLDQIVTHFSNGSKISEFEDRHIQSSIRSINDAINKAKMIKSGNLKTFVDHVCQELGDKLVISQDALNAFMILNNANQEQFAHWFTECVNEMGQALREDFKKSNIQIKLKHFHVKPQNELFTKLMGCGKHCPFCKAPCDAGGNAHTEHWASLHRPEGLGRYRWYQTKKLVTDICTSSVISDDNFRCNVTNKEWHPYKKYTDIFPDWKIPPDVSLQASDYWKYILSRFNSMFAEAYNAQPADIPKTWKNITRKQAEESLRESFNIK
ncbi:up-regulator of cell proliferation-like [Seriola lalandi dorsalis]|uniref:up-regulator of cell proliferation-like n=1 Tax=Seriola lalandi dorsalis TaxID=1841481 RepID=UPI000C6FC6B9|nr:up-regulator of cell proliferation-like [Seriola lalandi dorsalis]